ncbi:D-inositol-3-phosphate glycosyltransferase [subsurface metagenome]
MKLLIITQKVDINDDNLGFFHRWIEKFSEKLDKVYVICLWQGKYNLPKNVSVYSMGKEKGVSKIGQLIRLQKNLIHILPKVDGVFIHMCSIYAIASFPLAKIFRKKMILWYAHGSVGFFLKLAEKLVDRICTSSLAGCRIKSKKVKVLGQGIDTNLFKPSSSDLEPQTSNIFRILSAGRISPIKDRETLVQAMDILINQKKIKDVEIKIVGSPLEDYEKKYFVKLKNLVQEKQLGSYIEFLGGVPNNQMPQYYQNSDLVVNLGHTGSMDKVVLEAMACECPVLTCNEAYQEILPEKYLFKKKDSEDLAEKIINLRGAQKDKNLRERIVKNHNLNGLADKIINIFQKQRNYLF